MDGPRTSGTNLLSIFNALSFAKSFNVPLNLPEIKPRFDISAMSLFYSASFCIQVSRGQTVLGSCLPEIAKGKVDHKLL